MLYNASNNLRIIHRPGNHHGFVDVESYFDWFDRAFHRRTAMLPLGWSGPSGADFPLTYLTSAGFDIRVFQAAVGPPPPVPPPSAPLAERVEWVLASINSSRGLSSGAVYSEEMDECRYPPPPHTHTHHSHTPPTTAAAASVHACRHTSMTLRAHTQTRSYIPLAHVNSCTHLTRTRVSRARIASRVQLRSDDDGPRSSGERCREGSSRHQQLQGCKRVRGSHYFLCVSVVNSVSDRAVNRACRATD
jgi:hypothetical protein